jgi:hypothetical protein
MKEELDEETLNRLSGFALIGFVILRSKDVCCRNIKVLLLSLDVLYSNRLVLFLDDVWEHFLINEECNEDVGESKGGKESIKGSEDRLLLE